eukprot:GHVU01232144.1.p3 GENE.GHVU01232144.1~~GHVU01232144.1.p3  ORF type:complete len:115 (+),score=18.71 GHVU01232144.1:374-718(+)
MEPILVPDEDSPDVWQILGGGGAEEAPDHTKGDSLVLYGILIALTLLPLFAGMLLLAWRANGPLLWQSCYAPSASDLASTPSPPTTTRGGGGTHHRTPLRSPRRESGRTALDSR